MNQLLEIIRNELKTIYFKRHQLIIIREEFISHSLKKIAKELDIPYIKLSLSLSEKLKDIPIHRRARKVKAIVQYILKEYNSKIFCLDYIELLFLPTLEQDPVRLFEDLSKNYILIISWKRKNQMGNSLIYGDRNHPEYYSCSEHEAIIIDR